MLIACIGERAKRFDVPADLSVLRDRETLEQVLASFGTKLVREVSDPAVIAVFRLAIRRGGPTPEVARALDSTGREDFRSAACLFATSNRLNKWRDAMPYLLPFLVQ